MILEAYSILLIEILYMKFMIKESFKISDLLEIEIEVKVVKK